MIKGCQKNVIWLRNTESEIFEQAYFILSDTASRKKKSEGDIIAEARRIIEQSPCGNYFASPTVCSRVKRKLPSAVVKLAFFFLGATAAGVPLALLFFL